MEIGIESNLDIIIVAQSYIYFEKLILQVKFLIFLKMYFHFFIIKKILF